MLPNPLPEGRPTKLTAEWLNKLVALGRELAGLTVTPPLYMTRSGGKITISAKDIYPVEIVRITGAQTPQGYYPGKVYRYNTSVNPPALYYVEDTKVWIPN